jgi:hypothetical protein
MHPTIEKIILSELLFACTLVIVGIVFFELGLLIGFIWLVFI